MEHIYDLVIIGSGPAGLAAAVYTQLTDVEEESNGILTYDRKVRKWELQEAKDFCPKE